MLRMLFFNIKKNDTALKTVPSNNYDIEKIKNYSFVVYELSNMTTSPLLVVFISAPY